MDREQRNNIERIVEQIDLAKESGIKVFVCGLTHTYSILRQTTEDGSFYEPHPHPLAEGKLVGKRLLSESDVLGLTKTNVVLLEGHTPDWVYDPSFNLLVKSTDALGEITSFTSPNFWEIVDTVNALGIKVRGMDIPYEGRSDIQDQLGFRDYLDLYRPLVRYCKKKMNRKSVSEEQRLLMEQFLKDDRITKNLYNPNHFYNACVHLDWLLERMQPQADFFLLAFATHLVDAKEMFKEYIKIRDLNILNVLYEELQGDKTVLLKIGEGHMSDEYGYLPGVFMQERLPYYHFFNFQSHTAEEVTTWERIKEQRKKS